MRCEHRNSVKKHSKRKKSLYEMRKNFFLFLQERDGKDDFRQLRVNHGERQVHDDQEGRVDEVGDVPECSSGRRCGRNRGAVGVGDLQHGLERNPCKVDDEDHDDQR
jgi:hypothetical protein